MDNNLSLRLLFTQKRVELCEDSRSFYLLMGKLLNNILKVAFTTTAKSSE